MNDKEKQLRLDLKYLRMAGIWSENSYCERRKVGCLVVKDKMIISDGYNGTPSGFENVCEDENNVTHPYVLHAEANAITADICKIHASTGTNRKIHAVFRMPAYTMCNPFPPFCCSYLPSFIL